MTKKVTVVFEDSVSLTDSEIIDQVKSIHGTNCLVTVDPVTNSPASNIYYGIAELITEEQANIFFDQNEQYGTKLLTLKADIDKQIKYILNRVIMDNEAKFL